MRIVRSGAAQGAVIVEEAVEPSAIDEDILAINDAQSPGHLARSSDFRTRNVTLIQGGTVRREVRIAQGRVDVIEGPWSRRIGLIIGRLCLNLAHPDVLGVDELVLVESPVLNTGSDRPDATSLGLDEEATSAIYRDLCTGRILDIMAASC